MEFRTVIKPLSLQGFFDHRSRIMTLGSCFADEISSFLKRDGFNIFSNPFGTLYNPLSISEALSRIIDKRYFSEKDVVCRKENGENIYCCLGTSSICNSLSASGCVELANKALEKAHAFLKDADILTITLGTARCFIYKDTDAPVANCHKLPSANFEVRQLSVNDVVSSLSASVNRLKEFNPGIKVLMTVSPNRYLSYGFHESQMDKSVLILSTGDLCSIKDVTYFPAYEAVVDDLRDYRFYADDMIHPSHQAVEYVYSLLCDSFFTPETKSISKECASITRMRNHRTLNDSQKGTHNINIENKEKELLVRYDFLSHFIDGNSI